MNSEFDPDSLRAIADVFDQASSRVAELAAMFASGATGPESPTVIGSSQAAAGYAHGLNGCLRGLAQLRASLATMGQKVTVAAAYYEQNEAANAEAADSVRGPDWTRPQ